MICDLNAKNTILISSLLLMLLFSLQNSFGQTGSSLQIVLTDQHSALIGNAIIKIKDGKGKSVKEINAKKSQDFLFNLPQGKYVVEIQAVGFKPIVKEVEINQGRSVLNQLLEIEEIKVDVKVEQELIEKRIEETLNRTWTAEEIENLPSDPNEIEKELKRKYGDDVIIRVNGFTGGQLPPKEQIASIRVTRSSFDAEFHQIGQTIVDIQTKAGGKNFFGFTNLFYDSSLFNARNSLEKSKLPSQNLNGFVFLTFPSIKNRTMFTAGLMNFITSRRQNIIAVTPNGNVNSKTSSNSLFLSPTINIIHNISKEHTLFTSYFLFNNRFTNLGVGGFNLPESAYSSNIQSHTLRLNESGPIRRTANQFRLEFVKKNARSIPNNRTVAINVIGAFNSGGATQNNSSSQQKLFLTDINYFDHKKHAFKIGGEVEYNRYKLNSFDNLNGRFTFSNLADYLNNKPYSYTQRQQSSITNLSQFQLAGFFQDDIRLRKNFQIGLGLRYEWQNNLSDYNNFSPRLSFTWSPDKEARLVLRSGAGVFYHWFETSNLSTILSNDGRKASDIIILNPSYPNLFLSGTTTQTLPPSVMQKDEKLTNPYTFISKTGFNFRINNIFNLEGFYTYRQGMHQFRSRDINAPINGIRANSNFGRIAQVESSGKTLENSLELELEGKLKKGFSFDANYKIGKVLSDFEDVFSLPVNNYNTKQEWAVSNLDQRHKLSTRLNFPSWKSFSFNTTFRLESGRPYTISTGKDDNGDSVINDRPFGFMRNSERGTWFRQVDANLSWKVKLGKEDEKNPLSKIKNQLVLTVNLQNLLNQTNKQNFIGIQTSPFFRQAISAAPARTIQFGLSWIF
ncbi:MAG: TonB-dependent receptor [Pyrinomonadaceae bacterium]|nr:TonB-dependent receptor [Pyrinomonadaceae bacterium]